MEVKVGSGDAPFIVWNTSLPTNKHDTVTSPDFTVFELNCNLQFKRDRAGKSSLMYVKLCASGVVSIPSERFIVTTCIAKENDDLICITKDHTYIHSSPFEIYISLFNSGKIEELYPNLASKGKLTLVFTFLAGKLLKLDEPSIKVKRESLGTSSFINESCVNSLVADLHTLLGGAHHDLELKCGDLCIPVHKAILSARSGVFASMLQNDVPEGRSSVVTLDNMEFPVLQKFLCYLYSGIVPELTVELACNLYEVGVTYRVEALMNRCVTFLVGHLTTDIACDLLVLADRHGDQLFTESVISYIMDHNVPKVYKDWLKFCNSHPILANQVLNRYVFKRKL